MVVYDVCPVPPFEYASVPLMANEPEFKLIALLYSEPAEVEKTGRAWFNDETVVDPLAATVKYCEPDDEATVKMGIVGAVEEPATERLAMGVDELIPI